MPMMRKKVHIPIPESVPMTNELGIFPFNFPASINSSSREPKER